VVASSGEITSAHATVRSVRKTLHVVLFWVVVVPAILSLVFGCIGLLSSAALGGLFLVQPEPVVAEPVDPGPDRVPLDELVGLSVDITRAEITAATGVLPGSLGMVDIYFEECAYDGVRYGVNHDAPEGLVDYLVFQSGNDRAALEAFDEYLARHMGNQFRGSFQEGRQYEWGQLVMQKEGGSGEIWLYNYHEGFTGPMYTPSLDHEARSRGLWILLLAALGAEEARAQLDTAWTDLGHDVPITALKQVDVSWDVVQAQAEMPQLFPQAIEGGMHRIGYRIHADHPWFTRASLAWDNESDDGVLEAVGFRTDEDRADEAFEPLRACLEDHLGPPDTEKDRFTEEVTHRWDPAHLDGLTLTTSGLSMSFDERQLSSARSARKAQNTMDGLLDVIASCSR